MSPNRASAVLLIHIGFVGLAPDDYEASVPSETLSRKLRKQTLKQHVKIYWLEKWNFNRNQ